MKTYELAALAAVAILLIICIYLISAKGERKRITLINSEGSRIELDVEIANTSATITKGLMGRKSLGEYEGMLFVFDSTAVRPFWMFNTTIPLDAIHFSENGTVVDIIEMEPCGLNMFKCRVYPPKEKAKYVLEVNMEFSKKNKIVVGNSSLILRDLAK